MPFSKLPFLVLLLPFLLAAKPKPVKVYILAGQSNMEGKAQILLLDHQIHAPETKDYFAHFHKDGKYTEREDVWINFLNRHGNLTVGYGSPKRIGVELEFGHVVGNHHDEQVLLIKTAWGGKSIGRDFRPPSSGLPDKETLAEILNKTNQNNKKRNRPEVSMDEIKSTYGHYYRLMLEEINGTLDNLKERFPDYQGQGYDIAGFIWFQGWNDMYNGYQDQYAKNMENLIRDVRKDLGKPKLPVVIGIMGQNGFKEASGNMAIVKAAQASMNQVSDFKGNVRAIPTDIHWDKRAAEAFPTWRKNFEQWKKIGSDFPYHYLGSALTFTRVGRDFAENILELQEGE